jgi:hypothetical protein
MSNAAAQCAGRVQDRPTGYWKLAQNAKKILFRGNEPKNVLKIKELSILRLKNEPKFEHQKRKSNPNMAENRQIPAHFRACAQVPEPTPERTLARASGHLVFAAASHPESSEPGPWR